MTTLGRAGAESARALSLRAGDRVRLRSWEEIQAQLDENGCTRDLPFMGEMLSMAGSTFTVESRADKTCDTINLEGCTRAMDDTVHLAGVRCDGSAHGGCQAYCLLWFREEWLDRADHPEVDTQPSSPPPDELRTRLERFADAKPRHYRCQATEALAASRPLLGSSHYLTDLRTRNVPWRRYPRFLWWMFVNLYQRGSGKLFPRWLRIRGGAPLPYLRGPVRDEQWPPTEPLDLQPGELVEVRSLEDIRDTLDATQSNRGLWFDQEMASLCGRRGRVLHRVERLIDEKSGRMLRIKKDLYIVEGMLGCEGVFHKLCTRGVMAMLRDAWLRRVDEESRA